MVPNDATIKAFAGYLPAEAEYQEEVMNEEADEEASEYYDEEEAAPSSNSDDDNDQQDPAANTDGGDASTQADTNKPEEEKKHSDDDSENEYDSDYDEEGRYIWGAENDDWEFYYKEDKEAYEAGQSTVPECLNPGALPVAG